MHTYLPSRARLLLAIATFGAAFSTHAQNRPPQPEAKQTFNPPQNTAPSQLNMPLMSVDEGQRFQQQRAVKTSDVPVSKMLQRESAATGAAKPSLEGVSGEAMNLPNSKPTLGHVLPTSHATPLGFPRADFAIGSSTQATQTVKGDKPSSSSGLSNAVIK
ncbi:hypothetical protein [Dyella mobilis]|uniref:Uncharacterized protein n=1 Tax=Dyella mobilis TaxID=1849582 RepID=A0ABS2KEU6_9GAMM|nr:hypothetical protein [Dyella mobilis]MBM7129699.1 hypothetical protein [Dyella mobilis]GLQ98034.1 hypothetical protein GCM10007863_24540 [Dyella mobilis]